jgi:hypothetical protein
MSKTYTIFGAGAAGLYTAWRLLNGKATNKQAETRQLAKGDVLELYDWGQYDFSEKHRGSRAAGARVCTWHFANDKRNSYVELGGMRYSFWDKAKPNSNSGQASGHRLVTEVIESLGLTKFSIPFNVTANQMLYLRGKNFYNNDISSMQPAPYNILNGGASQTPGAGFTKVESLGVTEDLTRKQWCDLYKNGRIKVSMPDSSVFQQGDLLKDIGYWNLLVDQLGIEGYEYAADGNGYSSNVINTNAAVSYNINDEFAPGTLYKTLSIGYSGLFNALFDEILKLCQAKGVVFLYHPNKRLHSIVWKNNKVVFTYASRKSPYIEEGCGEVDAAWLAIPRAAIDLVAQATRFQTPVDGVLDVLNHEKVSLYLESTIMQPSYKVGMFFDTPWWTIATYPPQLSAFFITDDVIAKLNFPNSLSEALRRSEIFEAVFTDKDGSDMIRAIENAVGAPLSWEHKKQLLTIARNDTIGPSVTNSPIRMVVYFGNNALDRNGKPVFGILASYDDEDNADFWRQLEKGPDQQVCTPNSQNTQPLEGPRKVPPRMVKMLRKLLAELHFGQGADYKLVPEPLESAYMDWSLPPFNAGYHEWAPHYDIGDVQRKIRKPSQLISGADADIFIVGEAYSNDQAWVEGAFCSAESTLNDYFGIEPMIDNTEYPFLCPSESELTSSSQKD